MPVVPEKASYCRSKDDESLSEEAAGEQHAGWGTTGRWLSAQPPGGGDRISKCWDVRFIESHGRLDLVVLVRLLQLRYRYMDIETMPSSSLMGCFCQIACGLI